MFTQTQIEKLWTLSEFAKHDLDLLDRLAKVEPMSNDAYNEKVRNILHSYNEQKMAIINEEEES